MGAKVVVQRGAGGSGEKEVGPPCNRRAPVELSGLATSDLPATSAGCSPGSPIGPRLNGGEWSLLSLLSGVRGMLFTRYSSIPKVATSSSSFVTRRIGTKG